MAKQRYISTSFWDDEWIATLNPSEKLLYLYLMTNPLTSISGIYKISTRRMVFDTGFNDDTIKIILGKFETDGKAYKCGEYMIIPTWPKHQRWEQRSKIKSGILNDLKALPVEIIDKAVSVNYDFPIPDDMVSKGIKGYGYHTNYSDTDTDTDTDIDTKSTAPATAVATPVKQPDLVKPKKNKPPEPVSPIYHAIKETYESQWEGNTLPSYAREGPAIKRYVKEAEKRSPDDPGAWARRACETHLQLKGDKDSLFSGQPFLPSIAMSGGLFPRLIEAMQGPPGERLSERDERKLKALGVI